MAKKLPATTDHDFDQKQAEVMELFIKAHTTQQIAKETGMTRGEVETYVNLWRDGTKGNQFLKDRVHDLVNTLDQHYSVLIQKQYEVVDEVDDLLKSVDDKLAASLLGQKTSALGRIAEYESKRVDVLHRAGVLEINDVGDELIEMERKQGVIIKILQDIASEYPSVRMEIARRLQEVNNGTPPAIVAPEVKQ